MVKFYELHDPSGPFIFSVAMDPSDICSEITGMMYNL